jgi:glycosyltransferase involved in cell wall biosynthesis
VPLENELVSVIIPVYNGDRYLGAAIESVLAQTYRPIEVIVVDDGSTDRSGQVAQQFPVRYFKQPHSGPGATRNCGIAQAQGELLAFLDADDLWTPDKLVSQIATLTAQPELDSVLGLVEQFNSPDIAETLPSARFARMPLNGLHPGTMLIKRAAFHRVGFFGTNWQVGDVVDWFVRAEEAPLAMVTLPQVVMRRRAHANNLTIRSRERAELEYTQILKARLDRRRLRQAR